MLTEFHKRFHDNPNICNWLKYYSILTWFKIDFVRERDWLRIGETTLTQNFVFDLWVLAEQMQLPIEIYESRNERTNGNDLEIFLETNLGYFFIAAQAKIVQRHNKYSTISHKVGSKYQIDLLLDYAKRKKGIPAYLFYNWIDGDDYDLLDDFRKKTRILIPSYGMSIADAGIIKSRFLKTSKWHIPTFSDINPDIAIPFSDLVCKTPDKWGKFDPSQNKNWPYNLYKRSEIAQGNEWSALNTPTGIGFIGPDVSKIRRPSKERKVFDNTLGFAPKYRVVLSKNLPERRLYHLT